MKFLTNNIVLFIFIIMLISINGYAKNTPPAPAAPAALAGTPPPEKVPINHNLILLTFAGTLFGLYTIYKHKQNKKRPV